MLPILHVSFYIIIKVWMNRYDFFQADSQKGWDAGDILMDYYDYSFSLMRMDTHWDIAGHGVWDTTCDFYDMNFDSMKCYTQFAGARGPCSKYVYKKVGRLDEARPSSYDEFVKYLNWNKEAVMWELEY